MKCLRCEFLGRWSQVVDVPRAVGEESIIAEGLHVVMLRIELFIFTVLIIRW
jgi:hypothetical protein